MRGVIIIHCLCTIIARTKSEIYGLCENQVENGHWDYFSIGGNFGNIIPISSRSKQHLSSPEEGSTFPLCAPQCVIEGIKWVSITRIRNIQWNAFQTGQLYGALDFQDPYTFIHSSRENGVESFTDMPSDEMRSMVNLAINYPRIQAWFVAVVDYHI